MVLEVAILNNTPHTEAAFEAAMCQDCIRSTARFRSLSTIETLLILGSFRSNY